MTGIINEQLALNSETTKKQNNGNMDVNEPQTCVSPVYSLPDEDKFYTQPILACKENFINNIETHSSSQIVNKVNSKELQIVDLCSDEEDNRFNFNVDVEMHRAMSNLSMTDNEVSKLDESQSVLENFYHVIQPIKTNSTKGMKVDNIVQNATITKVTNRTEVTEQQSQNILDNFNQNKIQSDILQNTNNGTQEKAISMIQNKKKYTLKEQNATNIPKLNDVAKLTITKTVQCLPPLINKNNQENDAIDLNAKKLVKKRNNKNKSKEIKAIRRRKKTEDGDSTQKSINKPKKSNISRTKIGAINNREELKSQNDNYNDNIRTGINTAKFKNNNSTNVNTKTQKAIPKIYNKKIEDDLSWVENVRYVREITTNEFDPKLANIEDFFWDNLTFPIEWNDQDFNVF